jgi:hypothetical protein
VGVGVGVGLGVGLGVGPGLGAGFDTGVGVGVGAGFDVFALTPAQPTMNPRNNRAKTKTLKAGIDCFIIFLHQGRSR